MDNIILRYLKIEETEYSVFVIRKDKGEHNNERHIKNLRI